MKSGIKILFILTLVSILCACNIQGEIIWDSGHHEFYEGFEGEVWLLNDATADITGGYIGALQCFDTSLVNVYDVSDIGLLRPNDSSAAIVYGGDINVIFTLGSSDTHIYSGSINEIDATDLSAVNLYTTDYELDPIGGTFGDGLLTGTWLYGGNFSIDLRSEDTINHLNFVPEPSTMSLFMIGSTIFTVIRRKARK